MKNDLFGDRMKLYENIECNNIFIPTLPIIVRLDGKSFHNYTRQLKKPYDTRFLNLMIETTKFITKETNAIIGYTQSEEISLILYSDNYKSEIFFNGKKFKLISVIASMVTGFFNKTILSYIPELSDKIAYFDCRIWNVPSQIEAVNAILWREYDATKNAISAAAQSVFSHNELQHKSSDQKQDMLFKYGINFNDYPPCFKCGTYIKRVVKDTKYTQNELLKLPKKHDENSNPDLIIKRSVYEEIKDFRLGNIINKVGVIFNNEEPTYF